MDSISFQFVFYKSFYNFEQRKRGSGGNFLFYARFVQAAAVAAVMDAGGRVPSSPPGGTREEGREEGKSRSPSPFIQLCPRSQLDSILG